METRTAIRTCPLCEATCGLELTVTARRVERIRGDAEDVLSRGFVCPKGASLQELHEDPDRLRTPLVRGADDVLRPASWEEAFAEIDRTDHLLILGANPMASNGSLLTAPDMRGRLRAIQARGGKVVVVDPRRTRTATSGWMTPARSRRTSMDWTACATSPPPSRPRRSLPSAASPPTTSAA